jgi:hypothetical protein
MPPDKPARSEDKVGDTIRCTLPCAELLRDFQLCCCNPQVKRVAPGQAPRLGKGGTLASRQAILHR